MARLSPLRTGHKDVLDYLKKQTDKKRAATICLSTRFRKFALLISLRRDLRRVVLRWYGWRDDLRVVLQWTGRLRQGSGQETGPFYQSQVESVSELATLLSGRFVEIPVYPLSLPEFLQFNGRDDTIILKDIVSRHEIRNVPLFQNNSRFVHANIGNTFSVKKVADHLKSQRLTISVDTVQKYLGYLTETYALHRVQRYDIKGKRNLEIHEKYYLGDIGLRNAVLGYRESAINGLLENLVYLERIYRTINPRPFSAWTQ